MVGLRGRHISFAVASAKIIEMIRTIPPPLINTINANTLLHFLNLQSDQTSIRVSVSVVLCQESYSLLLSALGKEPTRRLGDKPDKEDDHDTGEALEDEGNAPLVVRVDVVGTVGNSSGGNTATKPTAVVETCISHD